MRSCAQLPADAVLLDGGQAAPPVAPGFAGLLTRHGGPEDVIVRGTWRRGELDLRRGELARLAAAWEPALRARGLRPGDTVALLRLPRRSEAVVAGAWVALATLGYRVLLPMSGDHPALGAWLRATDTRLVLRPGPGEDEGREEDQRVAAALDATLGALGLPALDPVGGLGFFEALRGPPPGALPDAAGHPGRECTVLTTSGTGGAPRLVRYTEEAWRRSLDAWEAAGLFHPDRHGGPGLCLLFAHSMGVRTLVNALWTGQPTVLVPPEWFLEEPARARAALLRAQPTHLTGGPAAFRLLLELGRAYPSLLEEGLRGLRCVVSVGAPFDPALARAVEAALRRPLHAGFGSTETLLVTSTLLGDAAPGALGAPLPGVRLGLVRADTSDTSVTVYRLHVACPWAATGELREPVLTPRGSAPEELANLSASGGGPLPGEPRSGEPGCASAASDAQQGRADPGGDARIGEPTRATRGGGADEPAKRPASGGAPGPGGPRRPEPGAASAASAGDGERAEPGGDGAWIGEPYAAWIDTGDHVTLDPGGASRWWGRADGDVFKDGFGVKVSRRQLAERYMATHPAVAHLEAFPLREEPGLLGLVWGPDPADPATRRLVTAAFEARNEALAGALDEQELRHATLARLAFLGGAPPQNRKGEPSRARIEAALRPELEELTGPWVAGPGRVRLDRLSLGGAALARHGGSARALLLHLARLDTAFHRARGDLLWYREEGEEREVLDLAGGFGVNLLGHRHPAVLAAARGALTDEGPPLFDQGSAQRALAGFTAALAGLLARRTGRAWVVRPVNTGAEAVELALAHAWLGWRRRLERLVEEERARWGESRPEAVAATEEAARRLLEEEAPRVYTLPRSFHGHSLGARALGARAKLRGPFAPLLRLERSEVATPEDVARAEAAHRRRVPVLDPRTGAPAERSFPGHFAAFAEPVRGEGGFEVVDPALLRALAGLDLPLVLDEVQCGLGRTGELPASPVVGDAFLFAKALGGGVAKLGAVAWVRERALADLDELYSSTFAGDVYSCAVGTAVLGLVEGQDVPGRARGVGERLRAGLEGVRARFPSVIAEVRGRGCMLGVHVAAPTQHLLVRACLDRELFGVALSGWLLHEAGLRVLPALDQQEVLRLEPSAFLAEVHIERVVAAFTRLAELLDGGELAALFGWLAPGAPTAHTTERGGVGGGGTGPAEAADANRFASSSAALPRVVRTGSRPLPPRIDTTLHPAPPGAARVGFVHHFVHPEAELLATHPGLAPLGEARLRGLFDRLVALADGHPSAAWSRALHGGRAWVHTEVLPLEPAAFEDARRSGETHRVVTRVQEAVDRCARAGCAVVVLGAATSTVTRNGEALRPPPGVRVVSGNSFTTALGAARARAAARAAGLEGARLGILGATGNIGAALARSLLGPGGFGAATLIGRDPAKLAALGPGLAREGLDLRVDTDVRALQECRVILTATATPAPLLFPEHLPEGPVLVADLAMPSPVARATWARAGVRRLRHADVVPLPRDPGFVASTHTAPGTSPCCLAEGLLVALHPAETAGLRLVGELDPAGFPTLEALARAEGLWPEEGA